MAPRRRVLRGVGQRLLHAAIDARGPSRRGPDEARRPRRSEAESPLLQALSTRVGMSSGPGKASPRSVETARLAPVSPSRASRPARLDLLDEPRVGVGAARPAGAPLELQGEAGEGVGQHVVQLAGQPSALGERCGLLTGGAGGLLLGKQLEAAGVRLLARRGVGRRPAAEAGAQHDLERAARTGCGPAERLGDAGGDERRRRPRRPACAARHPQARGRPSP